MKDAKDVLSAFLSGSKLTEAGQISDFFNAWSSAAGDNLAAHSKIKELENGLVIVETDHPGWIQLLKIEEKKILQKLQRRFPSLNIRGLRFRLGTPEPRERHPDEPGGKIHRIVTDTSEEKRDLKESGKPETDDKKAFFSTLERLGKLIENDDRD